MTMRAVSLIFWACALIAVKAQDNTSNETTESETTSVAGNENETTSVAGNESETTSVAENETAESETTSAASESETTSGAASGSTTAPSETTGSSEGTTGGAQGGGDIPSGSMPSDLEEAEAEGAAAAEGVRLFDSAPRQSVGSKSLGGIAVFGVMGGVAMFIAAAVMVVRRVAEPVPLTDEMDAALAPEE